MATVKKPLMKAKKGKAVSASQAKRLAAMLKAKKITKPALPIVTKKVNIAKITPPGMDAEDLVDGGADEDTEKK